MDHGRWRVRGLKGGFNAATAAMKEEMLVAGWAWRSARLWQSWVSSLMGSVAPPSALVTALVTGLSVSCDRDLLWLIVSHRGRSWG
jgi:hypothetical protein